MRVDLQNLGRQHLVSRAYGEWPLLPESYSPHPASQEEILLSHSFG